MFHLPLGVRNNLTVDQKIDELFDDTLVFRIKFYMYL